MLALLYLIGICIAVMFVMDIVFKMAVRAVGVPTEDCKGHKWEYVGDTNKMICSVCKKTPEEVLGIK